MKAISSKEFEKKSCGDVLTVSFPGALRAKYLDLVKWTKSWQPNDARKAGVKLAKKSMIKEKIRKSEILKYKDLNSQNSRINNVLNNIIQNLNFSDFTQFENSIVGKLNIELALYNFLRFFLLPQQSFFQNNLLHDDNHFF